jgi:uncharacterized protein
MSQCVVWVDIPVHDLERAMRFYSAVLGSPVSKEGGPGFVFGLLPNSDTGVGGCLYSPGDNNAPSPRGPLVYLSAEAGLSDAVQAVTANDGQVMEDVHPIGQQGFRAIVLDSEGNRIALHARVI